VDPAPCTLTAGQVGQDWKEEHSSCSAARSSAHGMESAGAADAGEARFERVCGIWCDHRCCTLLLYPSLYRGSRFRIMSLNCGARGTRTPDPLLANRRQHVHRRPSPQVTVLGRAPASVQIPACCCTFALYIHRRQLARRPVERESRHCSTRMAHRGPEALARRPSPVSSSQPSVSASATYAESYAVTFARNS
jgi:hypothetical protein